VYLTVICRGVAQPQLFRSGGFTSQGKAAPRSILPIELSGDQDELLPKPQPALPGFEDDFTWTFIFAAPLHTHIASATMSAAPASGAAPAAKATTTDKNAEPTKDTKPAAALEEDDEFEDFPVESTLSSYTPR
jgi:hypothetical protein